MYAQKETASMKKAISETTRRREIQREYNEKHNIVPTSIKKNINLFKYSNKENQSNLEGLVDEDIKAYEAQELDLEDIVKDLEFKMKKAAQNLEFETAAEYRDKIKELMELQRF